MQNPQIHGHRNNQNNTQQVNPLQLHLLRQQQGRTASLIAQDNRPRLFLKTQVFNSARAR
jgi:hypothetical protein